MSVAYRTVGWNPQKRRYDLVAAASIAVYLLIFVAIQALTRPELTIETLMIRALGSAAFLLLNGILCIGPLARLDRRFLPVLYNRRHLGVMMFTLALAHGLFGLVQFHAFGTLDPLVSLLVSNGRYGSLSAWPFQPLGFAALLILFLMAATSHDFWLHNLTAPVWKTLHMGVYLAYVLIVLHVLFGALRGETDPTLGWLLGAAATTVIALHAAAAIREAPRDREPRPEQTRADGFVDVCAVEAIPDRRAVITCLSGERVAVFRYGGKVSAISNVCQHQNGPLGEGRIVNDCIVCPWHGYEYFPDTGASPPPFTEAVPTFNIRIRAGRVLVHPQPNPPGTRLAPALIDEGRSERRNDEPETRP
jgi:nitrite reductase/ring-hydroxylating ferredoxin subunit/DMSO/TMAO reductase YedYZ heme-binding membrane subunit